VEQESMVVVELVVVVELEAVEWVVQVLMEL